MNNYKSFQIIDTESPEFNISILFKTEEDIENFFINPGVVLNLLKHSLAPDMGEGTREETLADIQYTIKRFLGSNLIQSVTYSTVYTGKVTIIRVNKGFLI